MTLSESLRDASMTETKTEPFMRRISIMFLALAIFSATCSGGGEPGGETAPTTTEAPAVFNIL